MRNMKRLIAAFAALTLLVLSMSGCKKYGPNEILYVYNWGEYIDKSVSVGRHCGYWQESS